jgi:hypothetical protein
MKAILEFDLPEDEEAFHVSAKAVDWYLVCLKLDRELRTMLKYRKAHAYVETIRKQLHELMEEHKVSLEDMS